MITGADAEVFDATVGSLAGGPAAQDEAAGRDDPAGLIPLRLDGKTVRGLASRRTGS